jgi:hypothetical protein
MRRAKWGAWVLCMVALTLARTDAVLADLRLAAVHVDLGDVPGSLPLRREFTFVNDGARPIEIVEARPSCGCLKPVLAKRAIAPGERGSVTLEVQTLGQAAGPHTWQLTLLYREGEGEGEGQTIRQQTLEMTGNVVLEVSVQPASLTVFASKEMTQELLVSDGRAVPLKIVRIDTTSPSLRAEAQPMTPSDFGGFSAKVKLTVTEATVQGRHEEAVLIYTDDPVYREFRVPVIIVR